jgi:hypothetical protein
MVEQKVRLLSEGLARAIERRTFIKRTGTVVFTSLAALAAGHGLVGTAKAGAEDGKGTPPWPPQCAPPGPYCNNGGGQLSGCHGSRCFQHLYNNEMLYCRYWYIYQAGCWTTPSGGGYWVCCDCECSYTIGGPRVATCGCAQYRDAQTPPPPLPDSPKG